MDFIAAETLAVEIKWAAVDNMTELESEDDPWRVALTPAR
jgi:hypothetical protein